MHTILRQIVEQTRRDTAQRARLASEPQLREAVDCAPPVRSLTSALRQPGLSLIAEFKPRSPSRGQLANSPDPLRYARAYQRAAAISVLCDATFFGGGLHLLPMFRAHSEVPILAKGFFLEPRQLLEVRAAGADAVLLITRLLDDATLGELLVLAQQIGLEALIEVHTGEELERALRLDAALIGVNHRDLDTLELNIGAGLELLAHVPRSVVRVSESGMETPAQVAALRQRAVRGDVDAVLIGSALMAAPDPVRALAELGFA